MKNPSIVLLFALFIATNGLKVKIYNEGEESHFKETSSSSSFVVKLITNGSYSLQINNNTWLSSAATSLRANGLDHDSYSKTLVLQQTTATDGHDVLGHWQSIDYYYQAIEDVNTKIKCSILTYDDYDLVRFTQYYPNGARKTSIPKNYDSVISSFPSFNVKKYDLFEEIGYLSYGGMMAGDMEKVYGKWNSLALSINGGIVGGPLILFNGKGDTLVISPMTEFMVTSMYHKVDLFEGSINYGIISGIDEVPVNFSVDFMIYYSNKGINKAMEEWGALLLKFYNKNTKLREEDFTINYLSYWTDNGAYYYWLTESNKTYEDTILDVVNTFQSQDIPFRSIQYDSWWYGAEKGYRQGCFLWNGNIPNDRFPNGMEYVYNLTKLPITAHNKFWDQTVQYSKQLGGSYDFYIDEFTFKALPCDQQFWDDLFANATKWGLKTYEQDWLNHQTIEMTPLMTNITLGKTWLKQMGNAALKNNITLQYCMSLSRHALSSLENDAVTQIRVTNDYATNWNYNGQQWRLGVSSIFSSALGLAPFKDVYWTSQTQPGNPYGPKAIDLYVELNSVVSILTTGPVGPGDKIGYMNKTLIMRSCNMEGLLLKPSKAVTSIDEQIYAIALGEKYGPSGEVWSTYSQISNYTFGILLAVDIKRDYLITKENAGFEVAANSVYWEDRLPSLISYFTGPDYPIKLDQNCTMKDFCLYHVAPSFTLNNVLVSVIGEQSKWVPMSPQRFTYMNVDFSSNIVTILANGVVGEQLVFSYTINLRLNVAMNCVFKSNLMKLVIDASSQNVTFSCS